MNPKGSLKSRLKEGKLVVGSWITLGHPAIAEIMANAGFDWLSIDLEHSVISLDQAEQLIRTADLCGAAPLARVTSNDPSQIKRVMDAGAHGVIVPQVNTVDDARRAVGSMYYPPKGSRGVGLARAQGYGATFENYNKWLADEAVVIVQIENKMAVDNMEAILDVEDVDGYIIGPYDLSASMGIAGQFDHSEFKGQIERIKSIGRKLKKPGGIHVVEPDVEQLKKRVDEGFTILAYSVDIRMIDVSSQIGLTAIKERR